MGHKKFLFLSITFLVIVITLFIYLAGSSQYNDDNLFCVENGYDKVVDGWFSRKYVLIDEYYEISQIYIKCVSDGKIGYVPNGIVRPSSIMR